MWIVIGVGVPVLVLAIAVAVWPVTSRSYRYHRWEHRRIEHDRRPLRQGRIRTDCTLCAASFEAPSAEEAVAEKNAHHLAAHAQSGSEAQPPVARGA